MARELVTVLAMVLLMVLRIETEDAVKADTA